MLRFLEWVIAVGPTLPFFEAKGSGGSWSDVGLRAFVASQNRSFKDFLKKLLDKGENQAPCEPDYLSIILASAQNDYDPPIRVIIRPDLPMLSEVDQATWVVPAPK